MPTGQRTDPFRNFRFRVEIDNIVQAGFSEATIPDTSTDVVDYREGTDPTHTRKLSGLTKHGNLTLKWGTTNSMDLFNWRKLVIDGKIKAARRSLSVILVDEEGNDAARWQFDGAWPSKYDAPDLTAKGNDVAVETLEIVFESMERVK